MKWLKRDALNRAWRTFMHSIGAAAIIGAVDAVIQVVVNALSVSATGAEVDWKQVATLAGSAALTAAVTPVLAYLHRLKLDPSPIPSATPPAQLWQGPT